MEAENNVTFIETLLPFAGIVFLIAIGVVLLTQQFRKNLYREQLEQEALRNKHQGELLRSTILVQEQERRRIAQDMHDELGAVLSITRMHLLQAERKHGSLDGQLLADLTNIRELTENSIDNMRRISHELMPPQLERFGLLKTLETITGQLETTGTIAVSVEDEAQVTADLNDELLNLTLYRVIMELINNTLKHARASEIVIRFYRQETTIVCAYRDNGIGLSQEGFDPGWGFGSMQRRMDSIGGRFEQKTGKGFAVRLYVPVIHNSTEQAS